MRESTTSFENIVANEKRKSLEKFLRFKNEYFDTPPDAEKYQEWQYSKDKADLHRYKHSPSFMLSVLQGVSLLVKYQILANPDALTCFEEYRKHFEKIKREKFDKNELADDIDVAATNEFLDFVIEELRKIQ